MSVLVYSTRPREEYTLNSTPDPTINPTLSRHSSDHSSNNKRKYTSTSYLFILDKQSPYYDFYYDF